MDSTACGEISMATFTLQGMAKGPLSNCLRRESSFKRLTCSATIRPTFALEDLTDEQPTSQKLRTNGSSVFASRNRDVLGNCSKTLRIKSAVPGVYSSFVSVVTKAIKIALAAQVDGILDQGRRRTKTVIQPVDSKKSRNFSVRNHNRGAIAAGHINTACCTHR